MYINRYGSYLNISNSKNVRGFCFCLDGAYEKDIEEFIHYFPKLNKINQSKIHKKRTKKFDYCLYYTKVIYYSSINSFDLENIDLCGNEFCVDHIIPIRFGYAYGIDFSIISSKKNLQVLSKKENIIKSTKINDKAIEVLNHFEIDYFDLVKNKKIVHQYIYKL